MTGFRKLSGARMKKKKIKRREPRMVPGGSYSMGRGRRPQRTKFVRSGETGANLLEVKRVLTGKSYQKDQRLVKHDIGFVSATSAGDILAG